MFEYLHFDFHLDFCRQIGAVGQSSRWLHFFTTLRGLRRLWVWRNWRQGARFLGTLSGWFGYFWGTEYKLGSLNLACSFTFQAKHVLRQSHLVQCRARFRLIIAHVFQLAPQKLQMIRWLSRLLYCWSSEGIYAKCFLKISLPEVVVVNAIVVRPHEYAQLLHRTVAAPLSLDWTIDD